MAVTDLFSGEITTELIKYLYSIVRKSALCRSSAERLLHHLNELLPIIQEINYVGNELPQYRQSQLNCFSEILISGLELCKKVSATNRWWKMYKNLHLARKLEQLEKKVAQFVEQGPLLAHVLAEVSHNRFDSIERFDRLEGSAHRLEQQLGSLRIGDGGGEGGGLWWEELRRTKELDSLCEGSLGMAVEVGVRKVRDMVMADGGGGGGNVVGICGIGGSGKTTLAGQLCRDDQVRSYFSDRIVFLTVSQSPNVEELRSRIGRFLSDTENAVASPVVPHWNFQCERNPGARALVVLDDVWSLQVLQQLIFRVPGCKTVVVSRDKFTTVVNETYEVELLNDDESMALFCHSAFGQQSVPLCADEQLVKQLLSECKGLPLALKVIGASLRGQPQMFWTSANHRLSRGEAIGECHETNLLERLKTSISCLKEKVRECFLDLASFPEDKKIPIAVLVNMWVEIHDIDAEDASHILLELSEKNLLTLVKDARTGDTYSSYHAIFVTQHDVLRDLALHLSNVGNPNQRKRLLMPRRESGLPKEWERNADKPFNAQIVSLHTGDMKETDWFPMQFSKAEVLILNFCSSNYSLPPFISNMPRLRALVLTNQNTSHAFLHNLSVFADMPYLRSLWLERISIPQLSETTIPFKKLHKISLILCKMSKSFDPSVVDLPQISPHLSDLTVDHCTDLEKLPISTCQLRSLVALSITNCHSLRELPVDLGMLRSLQILRIYGCPDLKILPPGLCQLVSLEYLDISQCVNLASLPEDFGRLTMLKKIDMRECCHIRTLPKSAVSLQSLRHVVCDEDISRMWEEVAKDLPRLRVQVAEESFDLDWLKE